MQRIGQTDGQAVRIAISISRVSMLTCDKNWKQYVILTEPEFSMTISKSVLVIIPVAVEILTAVFTSLNYLQRHTTDRDSHT